MSEVVQTHHYADLDGVRLHYVEAGKGPLVVLIHGFPDFWYTWRHLIPALVAAGYRVIAPDLRGFNLSGKPEGIRAYGVRTVLEDIAGLLKSVGAERASVVGHDLGAGIAWAFAMAHPEMVDKLAVLNGPHPQRLIDNMKNPVQLMKSWYVFFFQIPWLPEAIARLDDFALFLDPLRDEPTREGAFDRKDLALYVEALAQPLAIESMINYYRAMFRPSTVIPITPVASPVLVIWGERDRHLGRELAEPDATLVPNAKVAYLPEGTHWVQHDCPERVGELLVDFLRVRP